MWLREELDWSEKTAQNYMAAARLIEDHGQEDADQRELANRIADLNEEIEAARLAGRIARDGSPALAESQRADGPILDFERFRFEMAFFVDLESDGGPPLRPASIYVKKETLSETMLASRQRYVEWYRGLKPPGGRIAGSRPAPCTASTTSGTPRPASSPATSALPPPTGPVGITATQGSRQNSATSPQAPTVGGLASARDSISRAIARCRLQAP